MDNFKFDICGEGLGTLKLALQIAHRHPAVGFKEINGELVLFWVEREGVTKLPFRMNSDDSLHFVSRWLEDSAVYPKELDHDGDNVKGWRVYCENWGHVKGFWEAMVAIQPIWSMHGK